MQNNRSIITIVLVCAPMSLGAFVSSCWSYDASDAYATDGGTSATGGTTSPSSGGSTSSGGSGGSGGSISPGGLPCEVLQAAGHDCVSAHSTVFVIVTGVLMARQERRRLKDAQMAATTH